MTDNSPKYAPMAVPVTGGGDNLGDRFIATAPVDSPSTEAQPYLEVVAPATLPEGYTFEAEANVHNFTVKVPAGGVEQGQRCSVPFPAGPTGYSGAAIPRASVPVGHWKDGLCDCFRHGVIHPVPWNAYCCPLVLLGQVMQRLKLTWLAKDGGTPAQTAGTFRAMLLITIVWQVPVRVLGHFVEPVNGFFVSLLWFVGDLGKSIPIETLRFLNITAFGWFAVIMVCRTRKRVRDRYGIPEERCGGCEDFCCAYWCGCCTLAQMARHTADYETFAGVCCSETGVPAHAPSIV